MKRIKQLLWGSPLLAGTLLLTATGLCGRLLGFVYRIFLSRTIGAEGLGIYQMIFPIYGICMAICASGMETAISRFVAAKRFGTKSILRTGFLISFSLSLLLAGCIWKGSDFLAVHVLMEPRCAELLPLMALTIPWTCIHDCICGCCYGSRKPSIAGLSHLVELTARMLLVFFLAWQKTEAGEEITVMLAVYGLLAGEAVSAIFTSLAFFLSQRREKTFHAPTLPFFQDFRLTASALMSMALPLIANRLVLSGLQSAEAILIPNRLAAFGLSSSEAVAAYGTLTGMATPFILFPSTITTSLATLLLPTVSQAQANGNHSHISLTTERSVSFSLLMGILFTGIFVLFGRDLGMVVFHNKAAGIYITILAWLCPFLYLATTLGSILNGLGKTKTTFFHHVACQLLLLAFVIWGIPRFGILAYLWGNLAAELFLTLLHVFALKKEVSFCFHAVENLLKPILATVLAAGILFFFRSQILPLLPPLHPWLCLILEGGLYGCCYLCAAFFTIS
ncbi:MAG: polysaccharide biosynthesis protein [bacterium]|nr:polysaccharide biosynthesis protein [bacterium]